MMRKHHSFQLPKVSNQQSREKTIQLINQQVAQQSLFQISKNQDSPRNRDHFWKEINKLSIVAKRYDKSSLSNPKKKQVEMMPVLDIKTYRQSSYDNNLQILNTTSYMVIDDRQSKRLVEKDKTLLHQQINRKAKYLFRSRNKNKLPALPIKNQLFSSSFYCSKIVAEAIEP